MLTHICIIALLVLGAFGASIIPCPETCTCDIIEEQLHVQCTSLNFLQRLQPKQMTKMIALNLSDQSISIIDPKLKLLRNLRTLDLSHNKINDLSSLPKLPKLENLDLSYNHLNKFDTHDFSKSIKNINLSNNIITEIPEDWTVLPNLKTVNFINNPIYCSCHTETVRTNLLKAEVKIIEPVICNWPSQLRGKHWTTDTNCVKKIDHNVWDLMQGDDPSLEGSGSGDVGINGYVENVDDDNVSFDSPTIEPEFITETRTKNENFVVTDTEIDTTVHADEGSGDDEDYISSSETQVEKDDVKTNEEHPKPCYFNCSTPPPVGKDDEENASDSPSFVDAVRIIYTDLSNGNNESSDKVNKNRKLETPVETETIAAVPKEGRKIDDVEQIKNVTPKEFEKVVEEPRRNAHTTYIVLSILLIVMILVIVYALVKSKNRRARNKRRRIEEKDMNKGTELKLLPPSTNQPEKVNNIPERTPLMNGQNGTQNGKTPEEPDPMPETKEDLKNWHPATNNDENDYIELRKKNEAEKELLTPEAKRVTIRASEIPDSVPKTPLLVNRHVSSDGNIITTPSVNQRA